MHSDPVLRTYTFFAQMEDTKGSPWNQSDSRGSLGTYCVTADLRSNLLRTA